MISSKVFSQLDYICRKLRGNECVFGSLQLIISGDFKQLKPVPNTAYKDSGDYCFNSPAWMKAMGHTVILNKILRQEEAQLISAINQLADGVISEDTSTFLNTLSRPLPSNVNPFYLFAHNYDVDITCHDFLYELQGYEHTYKAQDTGNVKLLCKSPVPKYLVVKVGCKVMLVTNLSQKLVNGLIGYVVEINDGFCLVNFENVGHIRLTPQTFSVYSQEEKTNLACRSQIPLKLAYAITMHKAQGMTLNEAVIDARHANNPGQLATAVGRVRTSAGIQLKNFKKELIPKQPIDVINFISSLQHSVEPLDGCACCRYNVHDNTVIEEFPLGGEVLVFEEDLEGDIEEAWGIQQVREDMSELISNDNRYSEKELPASVNIDDIRSQVSIDFTPPENQTQHNLQKLDAAINREDLHSYLSQLWDILQTNSSNITSKTYVKNKECTKIISSFDSYCLSDNHDADLVRLFHHNPDSNEKRLAFKYRQKLLHVFWGEQARERQPATGPSQSESNPSDASRAGIRYLAGMSIAKSRFKHRQLIINNIHKKSERDRVHDQRLQENLLEQLTVDQNIIEQTTNDTPSLQLIKNKQNLRMGLTHVTDDTYNFFLLLDTELSNMLQECDVSKHKGNIFVAANEKITGSDILFQAWKSLFWPTVMPNQFMRDFMMSSIQPYIHVKWNQLRKDLIDKGRDDKTLEIRKAIWNRHHARNESPAQTVTSDPVITATGKTSQSGSTITLSLLQSICTSRPVSALRKFNKDQLQEWCAMYGITTSSNSTKISMATKLKEEVMRCSSVGETSSGNSGNKTYSTPKQSETIQGKSIIEYTCPKCNQLYLDDNLWVGCDNDDCGLFICRGCAGLLDEGSYGEAVSRHWTCPFC